MHSQSLLLDYIRLKHNEPSLTSSDYHKTEKASIGNLLTTCNPFFCRISGNFDIVPSRAVSRCFCHSLHVTAGNLRGETFKCEIHFLREGLDWAIFNLGVFDGFICEVRWLTIWCIRTTDILGHLQRFWSKAFGIALHSSIDFEIMFFYYNMEQFWDVAWDQNKYDFVPSFILDWLMGWISKLICFFIDEVEVCYFLVRLLWYLW